MSESHAEGTGRPTHPALAAATVLCLIVLLITAVGMIGEGFQWASGGAAAARRLFGFAGNPLVGLFVGLLATAVVQSSSTTTSVIVGLVAGGLPVPTAIPMVMGANIGTTVTNTLVSLGHVTRTQEFRRAFAAATVHDLFNLLAVILFLPLEMFTGLLERVTNPVGVLFAEKATSGFQVEDYNYLKLMTKALIGLLYRKVSLAGGASAAEGALAPLGRPWGGIVLVVLGLVLVFVSILHLSQVLRRNLTGRAERLFHAALGRGPLQGIASGLIITTLVQSSSTTTSLVVPMAGAGLLSLRQVFPFTLGANIGTCLTSLLAATGVTTHADVAMQIAAVHLGFNFLGTLVIYGIPPLRRIPLAGAERLAALAQRHRTFAVAWVLGVFFLLPLLAILLLGGSR